MPETSHSPLRGRVVYGIGRVLQACGYMVCLCGMVVAGYQVFTGKGLGGWLVTFQQIWLGSADLPRSATVMGALLMVPGLAVAQLGASFVRRGIPADPVAESQRIARCHDALLGKRQMTTPRMVAILLCGFVAVAAIAAITALWPVAD